MAAPTCTWCGDRRWVRYFSETTDGDFEEAFKLCPCNHRPQALRSQGYYCEEPEWAKDISREKPTSPSIIGVIDLQIELRCRRSL
jgi:hypothetical protein